MAVGQEPARDIVLRKNKSRITVPQGTYFYDTATVLVAANVFGAARRQDLFLPVFLLVHILLIFLSWMHKHTLREMLVLAVVFDP